MNDETLIFSGKKFISSRRASKLVGYSIDYIGQLARANKVESQMVGRTRFVSESSLLEYIHQGNEKTEIYGNEVDSSKAISKSISLPRDKNIDEFFSSKVPKKERKEVYHLAVVTLALLLIVGVYFVNVLPVATGFQLFVSGAKDVVSFFRGEENANSYLALIENGETSPIFRDKFKALDDKVMPYFERADRVVITFAKKVRNALLGWVKKASVLTRRKSNTETNTTVINQPTSTVTVNPNGEKGVLIPAGLNEDEIRGVVREMMLREKDVFAPGGPYGGLVTLQSSGDPVKDAETIAQIKRSFSDEVMVSFDQSGRSGVIKPVFRNTGDTNPYIFVLVPVNQ